MHDKNVNYFDDCMQIYLETLGSSIDSMFSILQIFQILQIPPILQVFQTLQSASHLSAVHQRAGGRGEALR